MKTGNEFVDKFVHEKGRQFYAHPLPDDIPRGEKGDCFDHCLLIAAKSQGKYLYCEGIAHPMGSDRWYHHAWLSDSTGTYAYDPTWKMEFKGKETSILAFYVGAVCDLELVTDFVFDTEYKSPFANYKKNPELAQKIFDTAK